MKACAILSMDNLDDFEAYDELLIEPLAKLGWQTEFVSWRAQQVDWNQFDVVIIRTPWDYQDDAPAFLQVLADIEQSKAILENSLDIVKWNIDKQYLKSLEQKGVLIVPSLWREQLDKTEIAAFFQYFNTQQLVMKPRISANADNTFWLTQAQAEQRADELVEVFKDKPFIIQPFVESVITEGEFSLFYFDGKYSHAILKTPKPDDFRVQEEHGGRLKTITPELVLVEAAEKTLHAIDELPMYARVDFVRTDQGFALMEAELIEPSLYFNMDDKSAQRFAEAFVARMARLYQL
ncbi:hypothetical protein LP316_05650 [Thalassotalea sp. LPB0316]|uniref:ATP-grasp domain-containing protein n=1 Tax=Thalassotalea sp. LPB0316 TaxID=2769490 RepID=UPI00186766DD|nr:hypothetical protein [Thalassotalea sp. LPB0316]QOL26781.1 hypothetical protein LP316_05650 [Thalassotalea sp. LPB0316]